MSKTTPPGLPAQWLTTMVEYEGLPLALRVRPAVDTKENLAAYPHLVIIAHQLDEVKSNGLPADAYNHSLLQFDMDIQAAIVASGSGFAFLVETFSGKRTYYGCFDEQAKVESRLKAVRKAHRRHRIKVSFCPDAAWQFYREYREQFPW